MDIDTLIEKLKTIKESNIGNEDQVVKINIRHTTILGKQLWYLSDVQDVYVINNGTIILDALN